MIKTKANGEYFSVENSHIFTWCVYKFKSDLAHLSLKAPLAYDAVWAVAMALNSSVAYLESLNQSLDSYNYDNKEVADIIMDNMEKVKFQGISVIF